MWFIQYILLSLPLVVGENPRERETLPTFKLRPENAVLLLCELLGFHLVPVAVNLLFPLIFIVAGRKSSLDLPVSRITLSKGKSLDGNCATTSHIAPLSPGLVTECS